MSGNTNRQFSWSSGRILSPQITRTFLSRLLLIVAIPVYLGSLPQACRGGDAYQAQASGPAPTPTPSSSATPTPTLYGSVLRARDVWQSFGVVTKNVVDCGGGGSNVYTISTACPSGTNNAVQNANVMSYLGFTKFRDDATHSDTGAQQVIIEMANLASPYLGVPVTGTELPIVDDVGDTTPANCPRPQTVYCGSRLDTLFEQQTLANAGVLAAIEFPNEIDNNTFAYVSNADGLTYYCMQNGSATGCGKYESELYALFKSDPILGPYRIIGLSHPGAELSDACVQDLTCGHSNASEPQGTVNADVANFHNYYQSDTAMAPIDNWTYYGEMVAFNPDGPLIQGDYLGTVTWGVAQALIDGGTNQLPPPVKVTTETGANIYNTAGLSRDIQGKSQINVLMDGIIEGWGDTATGLSTVIYEAIEHSTYDLGWGMVNPTAAMNQAFNPSVVAQGTTAAGIPGGDYMHNFMSLIMDTGATNYTATTPAGFSVTDGSALNHHQLLEKASGEYDLALWGEAYASQTSSNASVTLPAGYTGTLYDVTSPAKTSGLFPPAPVQTGLTGTVTVPLTDHMKILRFLLGPGPTPTPTPTATPKPTPTLTPTATPTPAFQFSNPPANSIQSGSVAVSIIGIPAGDYAKVYLPNAPVGGACAFGQYDAAWNGGGTPFGSGPGGCAIYSTSFNYPTTFDLNGPSGFYATAVTPGGATDQTAQVNFTIQNVGTPAFQFSNPPANSIQSGSVAVSIIGIPGPD